MPTGGNTASGSGNTVASGGNYINAWGLGGGCSNWRQLTSPAVLETMSSLVATISILVRPNTNCVPSHSFHADTGYHHSYAEAQGRYSGLVCPLHVQVSYL